MGFDSVATTAIMFIALLIMATGLVAVFKANTDNMISSATVKQQSYANQLKSQITIEHAHYANNRLIVYIKNMGIPLKPELITIYTGQDYYHLNTTNSQIVAETDTINTGILDKNEVLKINVSATLDANTQYTVKAFTQYETSAIKTFTT